MVIKDISFLQIDPKEIPFRNILIVVLALLLLYTCNRSNKIETSSTVKSLALEAMAKHYVTKTNKLGETVNLQQTLIFDRDKSIEKELAKNSELEKINTQINITTDTKINNILVKYSGNVTTGSVVIKYVDSSGTNKDSTADCIAVGTKFSDSTKWYALNGMITKTGVNISSLSSVDSTTYNLGMQRRSGLKGYFQNWDPTLEVIHSNPYVKTKSLQNITLKDKPKWYEKKLVWGGAGLTLGIIGTVFLLAK